MDPDGVNSMKAEPKAPLSEGKVLDQESVDPDDDGDHMSDYIDENFEADETDERWGVEDHEPAKMKPNDNSLAAVTAQCLPLQNDAVLKVTAGVEYVDRARNLAMQVEYEKQLSQVKKLPKPGLKKLVHCDSFNSELQHAARRYVMGASIGSSGRGQEELKESKQK